MGKRIKQLTRSKSTSPNHTPIRTPPAPPSPGHDDNDHNDEGASKFQTQRPPEGRGKPQSRLRQAQRVKPHHPPRPPFKRSWPTKVELWAIVNN
ncbi:unnamed protein product [Microthlaspi erraticum]|uniref:Uncharacterized protein n=1 Tax=Microthlaspi erraticum TaxID=1685480 RepID=A0A6D2J391_9BRAS|nr:unnamed protein product [Microthlaspi erraticum]